MIKRLTFSLLLAALAGVLLLSAALAEPLSLAELKPTVPERLQAEWTAPDGETVVIDAPVTLPEGDRAPILIVKYQPISLEQTKPLRDQYRMTEQEKKTWKMNNGGVWMSYAFAPGKKSKMFEPYGNIRERREGIQPDHNQIPMERPYQKLLEIMELCGLKADIRQVSLLGTSQAYQYKEGPVTTSDRGDTYQKIQIQKDKPAKGYEVGYYELCADQWMDGIRVLGWGAHNGLTMISEEDFSIWLRLLEPVETLEEDAKLVPFSAIEKAIGQRAQSGQLKSVYSVDFGYAMRFLGEDPDPAPSEVRHKLWPVWRVRGFDMKHIAGRADRDYAYPTEEECYDGSAYEIFFDATTGDYCENAFFSEVKPGTVKMGEN